ncbi:MAG: sigma-70 family RNA polymerase sigma factor [Limisphaera sp.]
MNPGDPVPSDADLAVAARRGDTAAFDELVRRHHQRIWQYLHACCRDPHTADDLTQETFVTAYRQLHHYDPGRPWLPWLYTLARHKWVDHVRSQRPPATPLEHAGETPHAASEALAQRELLEDLWHWAGQQLPPLQFQVLWLRYVEDLSVAEIARFLRLTPVYVKVLLFRIRRVLAEEWSVRHRSAVSASAVTSPQPRADSASLPPTHLKASLGP